MREYAVLAMVFGMLFVGMVSASSCAGSLVGFKVLNVVWGNSTHQVAAGPGQMDVPLTITLQNYGSTCSLQNVKGVLEVYGGFSNFNGSSGYPAYYTQLISPSSITDMSFDLNIGSNVLAGPSTSYSYILYLYFNLTNSSSRYSQTVGIQIPMHGSPDLLFTPNDRALIAGEVNNLTVRVTNSGSGYAYGIDTAPSSSSVAILENNPQPINSLAPGETRNITLQLYVPASSAGQSVSLALDSYYISPYGYNTSLTGSLGLYALSALQSTISVSASTPEIQSGRVDMVNITIANNGASAINNLSAIFSPQSPMTLIGSEGYENFGSIAPGASVTVPLEVYIAPSTTSGTVADLDVQLSYSGQSEGNPRVLSFLTPGYVNITQVSTTVLPSAPQKGGIFSLTSTLNNLGTTTASAATVTAYPPAGISVLGANSSFIGDISPDNPTAFTVSFKVAPTAKSGTYVIPVVLTYSNNLNQRVNTALNFSVDIGNGSSNVTIISNGGTQGNRGTTVHAGSSAGAVIAAIVVLAIAGAGIYFYRKGRGRVHR